LSDSAQIVVDIEVSAEGAAELANAVRAWLVGEQIIEQAQSDSVLSGSGGGHRPGINYRAAIKMDEDTFLRLSVNGVKIAVGRQVFDAGANGIELRCDACGVSFEPDDSWSDAVGAWFDGDNLASFPCPSCGQRPLLREWRGPWPWGLGNLGVKFWNWPPLPNCGPEQVQQIEQVRGRDASYSLPRHCAHVPVRHLGR
jgi:predicted RNA-binding Zn-ribbon protein involved in translation (DUF1610 family)